MKLFIVVVIGAASSGQDDQPECDPADERELHLPDLLPAPLGPAAGGAGALQQSHGTQRPCLVLQVDLWPISYVSYIYHQMSMSIVNE